VLKEGAGIEEVRRMVTKITGNELCEQNVWFNLKYDQGLVMALEGDADVRMFFKGNDEHGYFYVGDGNGPRRRPEQTCVARAGRAYSCQQGVVYARSGANGNGSGQGGCSGAELKRYVTCTNCYDEVQTGMWIDLLTCSQC